MFINLTAKVATVIETLAETVIVTTLNVPYGIRKAA